jgi:hypothetical protein
MNEFRVLSRTLVTLLCTASAADAQVLGHAKISHGNGGFPAVLDDGDLFGSGLERCDLDGDGRFELLVGAERAQGGEGELWMLWLDAAGAVIQDLVVREGVNGFQGPLAGDDLFGRQVVDLGDLNGDGAPELAVGAHGTDVGGIDQGAVWILFLDPSQPGHVIGELRLAKGQNGAPDWSDVSENFGIGLAALGDLDGDGVNDLAVGADPGFSLASDKGGRVWILFLQSNGTVKSFTEIAEFKGGFNVDLATNDRFGIGIETLGDLDQDGVVDIAVGAYGDDQAGPEFGAVYVLFLKSDGTVRSHTKLTQGVGGMTCTLAALDAFGAGLSWFPATRQLVAGVFGADPGGASLILDLDTDGTVTHCARLSEGENGYCGDLDSEDLFGRASSNIGDIDGDGRDDLALGAPGDDDGGTDRGAVWLAFLAGSDLFTYCACPTVIAPCANADASGGCANSTGAGAALGFAGGPSTSADDLTLMANGVPAGVLGIYFMGGGQACPKPFGDGLLCVSPGPAAFCRYPIQGSGAAGVLTLGPGIVSLSQSFAPECRIDPGDTWRFQAWYRDPVGPCGSAFNLSSAVSVTFGP